MLNKISEWFETDEDGHGGLGDWDISRDAPYFGIEIPDAPGKYFYVWLDAPIGYLASLKNHFDKGGARRSASRARSTSSWPTRRSSRCTSSARTSSTSTRCSGRRCCTSAAARRPTNVFVHGFITVRDEKMSKSRGTGISPLRYLELGMDAEWLRYYIAAKLNAQVEDIDFNPEDFVARVNSDLVGKLVNIASRASELPAPSTSTAGWRRARLVRLQGRALEAPVCPALHSAPTRGDLAELYEEREFGKVVREVMALADARQRVLRREEALAAGQGHRAAPRRAARRLHDVRSRLPRC